MKEIPHGIRTQQGRADRPPRRRRHRQPAHERRPRRQSEHRHRRELHQQADRRQGRQDRVAPGRDLPGRADRHVPEARHQGPAGLHRRQAADPALVQSPARTATGSRPRFCSSPADASSFWTSPTATARRTRPTRPRRATPAPPLRRTPKTAPGFLSSDPPSSLRFLPPDWGRRIRAGPPFADGLESPAAMALRCVSAAGGGGKRMRGVRLCREREHDPRHHERLRPGGGHRPRLRHPSRGGAHPAPHRPGPLDDRAEPARAALRLALRLPRRLPPGPRRAVPALGRGHGGQAPGALRRRSPPRSASSTSTAPARASACTPTTPISGRSWRRSRSPTTGRCSSAAAPCAPTPATRFRATRSRCCPGAPCWCSRAPRAPRGCTASTGTQAGDAGATRISATFRTLASGAGRP